MTTIYSSIEEPLRVRIAESVEAWNVEVASMLPTPSSIILYGNRLGVPVVLKIVRAFGDEWHGGEVLTAFDGHGIVRVLEFVEGAMLLESLRPGMQLYEWAKDGRDDDATRIVADTMERIHRSNAPIDRFTTIEELGSGFDRYRTSGSTLIDLDLVESAQREYDDLSATQCVRRLLHGDLHHYNILDDAMRGWTAIDPKGVVGEAEYECGASLRNPFDMPELFCAPEVVRRRADIYASRLQLDADRILRWAFAQGVLATIWSVEDGDIVDDEHSFLRLARSIQTILE